ncbi:hypothetical protein [Gluconobacter thailandicus]|uniref:hypothetical protein n=1 Tax=Gluconobacter thailandicus TaxID=257438 RepID=UPI00142F7A7F|nr:hypothetical protein [Gluconobacter thailandicus]
MTETPNPLLDDKPLCVVNIGIELFADTLRQQSVDVVQVQWTPPASQDEDLMSLLDSLI